MAGRNSHTMFHSAGRFENYTQNIVIGIGFQSIMHGIPVMLALDTLMLPYLSKVRNTDGFIWKLHIEFDYIHIKNFQWHKLFSVTGIMVTNKIPLNV